jgi:membrane-associated protease RseP (regulator of RpoE activity)
MSSSTRRLLVHGGLFALTALTTTFTGAVMSDPHLVPSIEWLAGGLPFSVSLLTILLCHEMGHYLMCVRYGIDASWPYFLPAPPILVPFGTFGAFIRVRSGFGDRRALFDMGAAGPWAGALVSVAVLIVGLRMSHVLPAPPERDMIVFGDSLLTTWLIRGVVGAEPDLVFIHPVALAGWFGLLVTSLNLLPVGQLDGGHVLYSAVGREMPLVSAVLAVGLAWLALRLWPGWILWAVVVVMMRRLGHPPTADNRLPLGPGRLVGAVASLILLVITFVPEPIRILP